MAQKKSNFYLTREELVREIIISKERHRQSNYPKTPAECFTPKLIEYLQLLVNKYANKGQWRGYSYIDDMKSEALLTLCQNAFKYDETRFDNPFGYYTQIIKYSFITSLEKEEIVRDIKDSLWEGIGMTPSYTRQVKNEILSKARDAAVERGYEIPSKDQHTSKAMRALKKDMDLLQEKIDLLARLGSRVSRMETPDLDMDFEISEALNVDPLPYTGELAACLSLFEKPPTYRVEENIQVADQTVNCLSVTDTSTKSETKRIIADTAPERIIIALCSIGLAVRRDLLVKEHREISGFNITPRYTGSSRDEQPEPEMETYSEYPAGDKRKRKKTK